MARFIRQSASNDENLNPHSILKNNETIISNGHVSFSVCSRYFATVSGNRVTVRGVGSDFVNTYSCVDKVEKAEFSPDSSYILCGQYSRCVVQAFGIQDTKWNCKINENIAGLTLAKWSSDSRHIITVSDFGIQMSIWSLVDNSVHIISSPKIGPSMSAFSKCGRFFAVAMRIECKDYIGVYSCDAVDGVWAEISKIKCRTNDLASIQWSPNGGHLIVTDSPLSYRLLVYTPAGEEVGCLEAYEHALGIRCVAYSAPYSAPSPSTAVPSLLAVLSFDGIIRLLSPACWRVAFALPMTHPRDMRPGFGALDDESRQMTPVVTTVESYHQDTEDFEGGPSVPVTSTTRTNRQALVVHAESAPRIYIHRNLKVLPKSLTLARDGVSQGHYKGLYWSSDGRFLASTDPESARCLWIWLAIKGQLSALLVQLEPIATVCWRPSRVVDSDVSGEDKGGEELSSDCSASPLLTFCTGTAKVYFWSPDDGVSWSQMPVDTSGQHAIQTITGLKWSDDGSALIVSGKRGEQGCCLCCSLERVKGSFVLVPLAH